MGQPLDNILDQKLLDAAEIVSVDYESPIVDITNREDEFSFQVTYSGGVNVDMTLSLEFSGDGNTFAEDVDSQQTITDPSGIHIWDIVASGARFIRVKITVTTGSINLDQVYYSGKRRH